MTFGYLGVWGALAGMSANGLTVHEANLEENEITFDGFPWLLRLRYIMENAASSKVFFLLVLGLHYLVLSLSLVRMLTLCGPAPTTPLVSTTWWPARPTPRNSRPADTTVNGEDGRKKRRREGSRTKVQIERKQRTRKRNVVEVK